MTVSGRYPTFAKLVTGNALCEPVVGFSCGECCPPREIRVNGHFQSFQPPLVMFLPGPTGGGFLLWVSHGAADAGRQAATVFRSFLNPGLDFRIQVANSAGRYLDPRGKLPGPFKPPAGCAGSPGYFSRFSAADNALSADIGDWNCVCHSLPLRFLAAPMLAVQFCSQ